MFSIKVHVVWVCISGSANVHVCVCENVLMDEFSEHNNQSTQKRTNKPTLTARHERYKHDETISNYLTYDSNVQHQNVKENQDWFISEFNQNLIMLHLCISEWGQIILITFEHVWDLHLLALNIHLCQDNLSAHHIYILTAQHKNWTVKKV